MAAALDSLTEARSAGVVVTACVYPYDYWATKLSQARFDAGWQQRFGISYGDLQIAGTTERLTAESFGRYRARGKLAVAYAIPDTAVSLALRAPFVMIGSDAILQPGNNNHPRASGTFARTLAVYVGGRGTVSLMEAIRKMTLLPAQALESRAPAMRRKGRLSVGADADIVIFDPSREHVFSTATSLMNVDYDLWAGQSVSGSPRQTLSRGTVVFDDGEILTRPGHGRFVKRRVFGSS